MYVWPTARRYPGEGEGGRVVSVNFLDVAKVYRQMRIINGPVAGKIFVRFLKENMKFLFPRKAPAIG